MSSDLRAVRLECGSSGSNYEKEEEEETKS
jgi:hypothetical protein